MSDENSKTETLPPYEPQPRGEARIPGINLDAIDARLAECTEYFQKHCDETDYRNLDWYLWRMQLRYAAGDDIFEVVDDAFMAARCLHDKHSMHLELKPPEMFATRRVTPVELGILSGMPMLTLEFSAVYGLPLMMVLGKTAPEDITGEANLMTSYFRRGFCADFVELTGLSAVIYAGVIAAIGRGFDDEAVIGLNAYATARDSLRGMPPKALLSKLKRYDALNTALACLCSGNFEDIGSILAPEADAFAEDQARRAGDDYLAPSKMPPPKYFDTAILTIIALAALRQQIVELPQNGAIAQYRDFLKGLTEMPERRIEMPALDEESRRILQEAGIDPNNLGVDNSFQDEKEASEARAAELFEERQRRAQEAVRAKIAQGIAEEESHQSVEPEKFEQEKLRLSDDDNSESDKKSKDFSSFFDNDDKDDEDARRALEDSAQAEAKDEKNYGDFFDGDDSPRPVDDDDAESDKGTKDFSSFFSQDSEEDRSLRENVEKENAPAESGTKDFSSFFSQNDSDDSSIRSHLDEESAVAEDNGKNYGSFFDNLDENAIPEFDDGSEDDDRQVKTFTSDFFSNETKLPSGLKMELEPEAAPVVEPKTGEEPVKVNVVREDVADDNGPKRDFNKFFDESAPQSPCGLKMTLDEEEKPAEVKKEEVPKAVEHTETVADIPDDGTPRRDFSKFFETTDERELLNEAGDESYAESASDQRDFNRFFDDKREAEREAELAAAVNEKYVESASEQRDFNRFFDDRHEAEREAELAAAVNEKYVEDADKQRNFGAFFEGESEEKEDEIDSEAQMRELEAEIKRKAQEDAQKQALKLELDGTEYEVKATESYQERMTRLIAEKQAAAREQAIREREEAERELEELKRNGVAKPVVEELQLKPTESDDPDEKVEKVGVEDLVIKGFAYDDLDMIHANTAVREDVEEDFDMHAAMAQKQFEEARAEKPEKNESAAHHDENEQDDDLLKW